MFVRRIAVVGTGYVGLTTGACLASLGHHVVCADVDAEKVKRLSSGEVDILEPGLADLVSGGLAAGRLQFVLGAAAAALTAETADELTTIYENLGSLSCTRIVIAHRISTIARADLILVMDEGQLVEAGKHEELLLRRGIYAELVRAQIEKTGRLA